MDSRILISVIVPVYKAEKYLDFCVSSITAQTYTKLEVILVDDGSPDASPAMCDAWAARDRRIKVIHKANGGVSDARNTGLREAKGDYVAFVDSDDWIEPNMMEIMMEALEKYDADIVNCQFVRRKSHQENNHIPPKYKTFVKNNIDSILLLNKNKIVTNHVCRNIFKRNLLENNVFPVGVNYEDIYVMHKLFFRSRKIVFIGDVLYNYFMNSDGIVRSKSEHSERCYLMALKKRYEFLSENIPEQKDMYARRISSTFYRIWKQKNRLYTKTKNEEVNLTLNEAEQFLIEIPLAKVKLRSIPGIALVKIRHFFFERKKRT